MGPFHEGERLAQERAGAVADALLNGEMVQDTILRGARPFLAALPLVAVATLDEGHMRASLLVGAPGFLAASERSVDLDLARVAEDPLGPRLDAGAFVGLLAIDLATRRRYRINGTVERPSATAARVAVREAFPNCPKYIQKRRLLAIAPRRAARPSVRGAALGAEQVALVARADTAFVASGHSGRGLDASHRGGHPGFIEAVAPDRLRIPDYAGNGMFTTLGNLLVDPRAALAIIDFDSQRLLEVSGTATVDFTAARSWELRVERFLERDLPLELRWSEPEPSPYNPRSGPGRSW